MHLTIEKKRQGSVMLLLLVMLVVGSIIATRTMPNEELLTVRRREEDLSLIMSEIRESFDLMKIASPTWEPWSDDFDPSHPDAPASIALTLKFLADNGFIRDEAIADPCVMQHLWGTGTSRIYWQASDNIASNSSFQISDNIIHNWEWNDAETVAATDTIFLEGWKSDDYPFQNKLGDPLQSSGASLKITR